MTCCFTDSSRMQRSSSATTPRPRQAVQWMLDLRPGNVPALLRGAALRRLYGDTEGAMDFFSQAYQQMPPTQAEDMAWTLTQMADLQLSVGHIDDCGKSSSLRAAKIPRLLSGPGKLRPASKRRGNNLLRGGGAASSTQSEVSDRRKPVCAGGGPRTRRSGGRSRCCVRRV